MENRINVKLVLELLSKGISAREMQRTRHIAPQSVSKVRAAAERFGIGWEDVAQLGDPEAYGLLFPEATKIEDSYIDPDYEYVHAELQRAGVNMLLRGLAD